MENVTPSTPVRGCPALSTSDPVNRINLGTEEQLSWVSAHGLCATTVADNRRATDMPIETLMLYKRSVHFYRSAVRWQIVPIEHKSNHYP